MESNQVVHATVEEILCHTGKYKNRISRWNYSSKSFVYYWNIKCKKDINKKCNGTCEKRRYFRSANLALLECEREARRLR